MQKVICDICGKEISSADIHIRFNIDIENKADTLDMHSICFAHFRDAIRQIVEREEKE